MVETRRHQRNASRRLTKARGSGMGSRGGGSRGGGSRDSGSRGGGSSGRAPRTAAITRGSADSARRPVVPERGGPSSSARLGSTVRSDSNRQSAIGTLRPATRVEARSGGVRGDFVSLRTKFMVLMAGLSGLGLIVLGVVMATIAYRYLFGQTLHKGVEIVKMASQLSGSLMAPRQNGPEGVGIIDRLAQTPRVELEDQLRHYFRNARTWGESEEYSDILAVTFYGGGAITGFNPVGEKMTEPGNKSGDYSSIFIPRLGGDITLTDDIKIFSFEKPVDGRGIIPVYRFRVKLNNPYPAPGYGPASIAVDIAGDTVAAVAYRLYAAIGIGAAVVIAVVVFFARLFATRITKPLRQLVRDMKIVAKGDLDHHTKALSNDEVGQLAVEFNRMTGDLKEAQNILVEQEKAAYELTIASEVQQQLLPAQAPEVPGWEMASYYQGAKAVSGDYYDFIPLGNGLWGFIIADVSGKGIPGSMVMAVTRTIVRLVANKHLTTAADTLKETNRLIAKQIKRGMFVTAYYTVLDVNSGIITFASAGHNPMVVYRASGKAELAAPKGIAIGFNEGPLFDKNIQQFQLQLQPGDGFVLFTDGFPEAMNEQDQEWGDDAFYRSIVRHGAQGARVIVDGVVADTAQHRGRAAQSDDLTMIVVTRSRG